MLHRFYKGNGPISVRIDDLENDGQGDIQFAEARLHLSAAGGAVGVVTYAITVDSAEGVEYNAILNGSVDMTALTDSRYAPDRWPFVRVKDHLLFEYANGSNRIWGLEVIYQSARG